MKLDKGTLGKLPALLQRFKYPALILLIGIALMLWPARKKETTTNPAQAVLPAQTEPDYRAALEQELAQILSQIDGAGQVRVMLTLQSGPANQYQTDEASETRTEGEKTDTSTRRETVILSRGSAYNEAAVVRQYYPVFRGALIVSQGGDDPAVRYQLACAVSALLGIGTDQITVVKMK